MQPQSYKVHLLFCLLFIKSEKNPPPAFCLKDITGNKQIVMFAISIILYSAINWSTQSCHLYLASTKFVPFIASLGSKPFAQLAGGSPRFAASAVAVICRCCLISTKEESSCAAGTLDSLLSHSQPEQLSSAGWGSSS